MCWVVCGSMAALVTVAAGMCEVVVWSGMAGAVHVCMLPLVCMCFAAVWRGDVCRGREHRHRVWRVDDHQLDRASGASAAWL